MKLGEEPLRIFNMFHDEMGKAHVDRIRFELRVLEQGHVELVKQVIIGRATIGFQANQMAGMLLNTLHEPLLLRTDAQFRSRNQCPTL